MKTFALYVAVLLALSAAPALGGVNSGGTACLSWNQSSVVTNIESLPGNPVALHVLLSGAPDVRSLAVHLRWSPRLERYRLLRFVVAK